jgi:hypothetical protein
MSSLAFRAGIMRVARAGFKLERTRLLDHLAMSERHIAKGAAHIAQQETLNRETRARRPTFQRSTRSTYYDAGNAGLPHQRLGTRPQRAGGAVGRLSWRIV